MEIEGIKVTPKWRKSKEEIWEGVFSGIVKEGGKMKYGIRWRDVAAAAKTAAAAVVVCVAFARLYTTTERAGRGEQAEVELPDGSRVKLNAESEVRYRPYWWFVSREVRMEGEGCFEVKRGSRFRVGCVEHGKQPSPVVQVLGTRFNIYSRGEKYRVTCLNGEVEVQLAGNPIRLGASMQASVQGGKVEIRRLMDGEDAVGWTEGRFVFSGVPLEEVVAEIERQYDIHVRSSSEQEYDIHVKASLEKEYDIHVKASSEQEYDIRVKASSEQEYLYTGNFSKPEDPSEALAIIGKPFGMTFIIAR
ncbi:MAG: FecR domain-containing protein [Tannerellaceae bacterium]|jgi:hypothetical protein|nr:FecR domain-containing protein [Tannerellaceae bacterium]